MEREGLAEFVDHRRKVLGLTHREVAELDALTVHEDRRVAEIASRRAWIEQARIIAGNLDELDTDERREVVRALNIRVRLFRREHSKAPPVYTVDPPSM